MPRQVVLLRGINLGSSNRLPMPALRDALSGAGFANVRTYVQSGNIVLETALGETELADAVGRLIAERFDLEIPVVALGADELAQVVAANPLRDLAESDPKRFQVTFLRGEAPAELEHTLGQVAAPTERVAVRAHGVYCWHPDGVARSKLWAKLGTKHGLGKGVTATSRNWTTVTTLLEMAAGDGD